MALGDRRRAGSRTAGLALMLCVLLSALAPSAHGASTAWVAFESDDVLDGDASPAYGHAFRVAGMPGEAVNVPFPMDVGFPVELPVSETRLRALATESGFVRVDADAETPTRTREAGSVHLVWRKTYVKGLPSEIASFTISATALFLLLDGPVDEVVPSASYSMTVRLVAGDFSQIGDTRDLKAPWQEQFQHEVKLQSNGQKPFLSVEKTSIKGAVVYDIDRGDTDSQRVM